MIKLLAIDLDGTTLNSSRTISPINAEAIKRAGEAGLLVVPASGRIAPSIRPYASGLGLGNSMICCNGAHVLGPDSEILHVGLIEEAKRTIVEYAFEQQEHLNLYCREDLFFTSDPEWGKTYLQRVTTIVPTVISKSEALTKSPTKMMIVADPSRMPKHHSTMERLLQGLKTDMVFSEPEYLEFLPSGSNKATGLRAFADYMGLEQKQVAAIGDYHNDLEMLEWAGLSAAVDNAPDDVKQSASVVVPSNDENGLAAFIYNHVLKS